MPAFASNLGIILLFTASLWHEIASRYLKQVMDKSRFSEQSEHLDPQYQNGQSDAEKLMSRHLQTPNDEITDEELKAIRITGENTSAPVASDERNVDGDDEDEGGAEPGQMMTPLDVLGD